MRARIVTGASLAAALLFTSATLAADLKSGPQPGKGLRPFNPLHCTGKGAGGKACLV